jgi:integrase/recombinase XerD
MFDRFFKLPRTMTRHENGPWVEERRRYLAHCAALQMKCSSLRQIAIYTLIIAETLRLAERPGALVTRAEIEAGADRYVRLSKRRCQPGRSKSLKGGHLRNSFRWHATRWLKFLGRLRTPPPAPRPYANLVAEFRDYLLRERGLAPSTIAVRSRTLQAFLDEIDEAGLSLNRLTVAQVNDLLVKEVHEHKYARHTIKTWATAIRAFLRFAERRGHCRRGMTAGIKSPHLYRHEGLPLGPSWDDVKKLLAATEGDCPIDIRDRAMLMLLAVYGLRGGEVTALRLEDFDWKQELLHVPHGKRMKPRAYPLCRSVGDAVLRYLREVRPRTHHRRIFLITVAPFSPLTDSALRAVVSFRLHALGLTLSHYGTHMLRHACASHLLSQGHSLKEIGDHLGHQSPQSTRVYAKVDLLALRSVGDFGLEGVL